MHQFRPQPGRANAGTPRPSSFRAHRGQAQITQTTWGRYHQAVGSAPKRSREGGPMVGVPAFEGGPNAPPRAPRGSGMGLGATVGGGGRGGRGEGQGRRTRLWALVGGKRLLREFHPPGSTRPLGRSPNGDEGKKKNDKNLWGRVGFLAPWGPSAFCRRRIHSSCSNIRWPAPIHERNIPAFFRAFKPDRSCSEGGLGRREGARARRRGARGSSAAVPRRASWGLLWRFG